MTECYVTSLQKPLLDPDKSIGSGYTVFELYAIGALGKNICVFLRATHYGHSSTGHNHLALLLFSFELLLLSS